MSWLDAGGKGPNRPGAPDQGDMVKDFLFPLLKWGAAIGLIILVAVLYARGGK